MVRVDFDEPRIDAIFRDIDRCGLPGAAVGVSIQGRPVYRKGFGLASMELPVLLSPTIRMRIYSTTKHFTCLAFMLLYEEGKASVDDPVGKYLPELNAASRGVSIRQLMGHTAGLRDAIDINYQFSGVGRHVSSADVLALYRDIDDVNFPAGTTWCYSNGGYLLLSAVIERIANRSLEEVLRDTLFDPLGLYDTSLRRRDTDFLPNSATGHTSKREGGYEKSYMGAESAGEGGMVSTVDDLLRWLAHMDAPRIGTPASWSLMKAPQILPNGTSTEYGFGLMWGQYRGLRTLYHAGGAYGGNSQMLKVPAAGLDIVILANRHDISTQDLTHRIIDACVHGLEPISMRSVPIAPIVTGTFLSRFTGRVVQLRGAPTERTGVATSVVQWALIDGLEMPMAADGSNVLWPAGLLRYMQLAVRMCGGGAEPSAIQLSDFGNVEDLERVPQGDDREAADIVGRYRSGGTDTDALVSQEDGRLLLRTVGRFGSAVYDLRHLGQGVWRAVSTAPIPWGGTLVFAEDATEFHYTSLVTRALRFRRCR